jgi:hypothetical protein
VVVVQNESDHRVRAATGCRFFSTAAGVGFRRRRRKQAGRDGLGAAEVRHHRQAGGDGEIETDEDDVDCCFHPTKIPHSRGRCNWLPATPPVWSHEKGGFKRRFLDSGSGMR